ncbi:MAG: DUF1553 domain-containing protein [Bryobacterales bacterium]|nr:DUF1553 domain-containing protein [Bryobacterales bacterium]
MRHSLLLLGAAAVTVLVAADTIAPLGTYKPAERRHWAFQPRATPAIPAFEEPADRSWAATPVDAFILARLKKEELRPSPEADPATLVRRLFYDLTGLPPSPADIQAFAKNPTREEWAKLVDKLLENPAYGERWGQHWLDVARFAETDGFEYDTHRRDAYRYRDYVVAAFQHDKPYDKFLIEQLAGDEMASDKDDEDLLVAAGFNRLGPLRKNAGNQEVASSRNEVLTEMTNAVGAAMLGVTLGCARCHDHKFDPIRQSDYYRIQAYFAGAHDNDVVAVSEEEQRAWKAKVEPIEAEMKRLREEMRKIPRENRDARDQMAKQIEEMQNKMPEPLPALFSVKTDPAKKSPIHLLARGEHTLRGDRVGMRPLGVLLPEDAPELPETTEKPRLELAKWVADPNNPLTARVMVNRIWQHHFGKGLVVTPNDFGRMGGRPSHPELLDYLANEFVASGFSVKQMHRLMLNTNAYRQSSSTRNETAEQKDPDNRLLWQFARRRLTAEEVRDSILAVSGQLNRKVGGPSVMVPIDQELVNALYKPSQWQVAQDETEHNRRSIYLIAKRNLRLPFMEVFDSPDLQNSCPRRETSTHAPQALELMNGSLTNEQAVHLAERLAKEASPDVREQVELAFLLAAGRKPNAEELRFATAFLTAAEDRDLARREFALAMFNLNAFLYVN